MEDRQQGLVLLKRCLDESILNARKNWLFPPKQVLDLIDLIDNELLKSAELTGRWEKRLKEIERGEFKAGTFIHNMKKMVYEMVEEVKANNYGKTNHFQSLPESKPVQSSKPAVKTTTVKSKKKVVGKTCP